MVTAMVTFPVGDIIAQYVTEKKVNFKRVGYAFANSPIYGAALYGLMQTGEFVGDIIKTNYSLINSAFKSVLGPNLWGNIFNAYFFVNNAVGSKAGYGINAINEEINNYKSIFTYDKNKYSGFSGFVKNFKEKTIDRIDWFDYKWYAVMPTITVWNVIQTLNYEYVSGDIRTPLAISLGIIWSPIITYASYKSAKLKAEPDNKLISD
jgi:hypothetical protein